jgi:hypothetical protein
VGATALAQAGCCGSGFACWRCPVRLAGGASLSFGSPKESKQRKGDDAVTLAVQGDKQIGNFLPSWCLVLLE